MVRSVIAYVFTLLVAGLILSPATVFSQDQNADLEKNVCSGTNLSLGSGGSHAGGFNRGCENPIGGTGKPEDRLNKVIGDLINILTVIVSIVAVIMIIVGAFRFITSAGDPGKVSAAKNTVLYAVVGLAIVALAQAIARFVLGQSTG